MAQYPLKPDDVQHITGKADLHGHAPERVTAQIFASSL